MGRLKMNVSVIYDSLTGNTGLLAERIRKNIVDSGVLDLVRFEKVSDLVSLRSDGALEEEEGDLRLVFASESELVAICSNWI